ncbi:MAG: tRNA (adenosine(37)-N6)-threonylcarbamoyltransferase complex dimerization subunit type 1 TsaB [Spirochaetota bacterium]
MNHLAVDCATEILSVALRCDRDRGSDVLVSVRDAGLRHTRRLMTLVDALLAEAGMQPADLDLVSCTRGPGSFIGLRIGMATAKGLAWAVAAARGLEAPPLVSVPTLDVMAATVASQTALVVPVIDGKKGRFYGAGYLAGRRMTPDLDLAARELLAAAEAGAAEPGAGAAGGEREHHPGAALREAIITGPHASRFVEAIAGAPAGGPQTPQPASHRTLVVDPAARAGWAATLLGLAEARLTTVGYDEIDRGPQYVRGSDAEIARASNAGL